LATVSESSFPADLLPFFEIFAPGSADARRAGITGGRKSRTEGSSTWATTRASFFCAFCSLPS